MNSTGVGGGAEDFGDRFGAGIHRGGSRPCEVWLASRLRSERKAKPAFGRAASKEALRFSLDRLHESLSSL